MRYFRRLPPLLRVASIVGLLCALATFPLFAELFATFLSSLSVDSVRVLIIALNLVMLGWACSLAVRIYSIRFRQPDGGPFLLSSWQSQMRTIVLVTTLPLCALALAVFIPATSSAFELVFPVSLIAAVVLITAYLIGAASTGPGRTPQAR